MKRNLAIIIVLALLPGCSDDSTGGKDSAPPDLSLDSATLDAPGGDSAPGDAAAPDSAAPDSAAADSAAPDLMVADSSPKPDSGYPACQKIISLCSGSSTWKSYISPFSLAACNATVSCVMKLYTGTCLSTFQSLVTCMAGVSSSSQCDTLCATQFNYLYQSCACPKSCGVPCT